MIKLLLLLATISHADTTYKAHWKKPEWTNTLVQAIDKYGPNLSTVKPKDAKEWCFEKYASPKAFYVSLISAMAKYESSYNIEAKYTENFNDKRGNKVISVGLMQVSSESCAARLYGGMPYTANNILKTPEKNFECTVRILNAWLAKDGVIAQGFGTSSKGAARYWSVVRTGSTHKREAIRKMVCQL